MQTRLHPRWSGSAAAREAEALIRRCVHCGFCNTACPTYGLLGDERDGPRGRIYLVRQLLEEGHAGPGTRRHLDRCLTCRACEMACPSGVEYGRLLELGRERLARLAPPPLPRRLAAFLLRRVVPWPRRFRAILRLGRGLRPLLPAAVRRHLPPLRPAGAFPAPRHPRRLLLPAGCVQQALAPGIDAAAARLLDRLGFSVESVQSGCCGALSLHLGAVEEARAHARRFIDACLSRRAEGIAMSASGCGVTVREYARLFRDDPRYAGRAARVAARTRDLCEWVRDAGPLPAVRRGRVACHDPCTLRHGQRLGGVVAGLLQAAGWQPIPVADADCCCGAAGSYFILQPRLAGQLLRRKLAALQADSPAYIATANVGCLAWLSSRARVPVRHWAELLDAPDGG